MFIYPELIQNITREGEHIQATETWTLTIFIRTHVHYLGVNMVIKEMFKRKSWKTFSLQRKEENQQNGKSVGQKNSIHCTKEYAKKTGGLEKANRLDKVKEW